MQVDRAPDEPLHELFEDLEQQAHGMHLLDRDDEVDELGRAEYAEVDLLSRLHGSVGATVRLALVDGLDLSGRLVVAGADFVAIEDLRATWLVRPGVVARVRGLSGRAVTEPARRAVARLRLTAMLRRLADDGAVVRIHLTSGERREGQVARVGKDFLELALEGARGADPTGVEVIGVAAVTAIRSPR